MNTILYHGSDAIVATPEFGKGKSANDYGRGFYCTENKELAGEWACKTGTNGYVNRYSLDRKGLKVLNLNGDEYSILNWLAVLTKHRSYWQQGSIAEEAKTYLQKEFYVDVSLYDLVIGYRADDSYFAFAQDFVSGAISLRKLDEAMHLGKLGEQIVLKSKKAFRALRFEDSEPAQASIYYPLKTERDRAAQKAYRESRSVAGGIGELYMLDIMREGIRHGDPRLS